MWWHNQLSGNMSVFLATSRRLNLCFLWTGSDWEHGNADGIGAGFQSWELSTNSCRKDFVYKNVTHEQQNRPCYGFVERVKVDASIRYVIVKSGMTLVSIDFQFVSESRSSCPHDSDEYTLKVHWCLNQYDLHVVDKPNTNNPIIHSIEKSWKIKFHGFPSQLSGRSSVFDD
jgi:hypothetical protein